ncbi:MAG: polysaccharide pyruvyl transferase family protein [Candidatus Thioglobus sp.]|nr:polysaccharide pyruvyl transferase family protein [Candidatus Thioglobus sp.]
MNKSYFLLNDTRFDNHHGCLTVINNLHHAMADRGWECLGSLPVSSKPSHLSRFFPKGDKPGLIVVNGEGSLHHSKRNSRNLLAICAELQKDYPVVLINALWQDNQIEKNITTLQAFKVIYTRDKRSQKELLNAGVNAKYAPDLTFYKYPTAEKPTLSNTYACTDSVINTWSIKARQLCDNKKNLDYLTMYTGKITHKRGLKDQIKSMKNSVYPRLYKYLKINVPPRYRVASNEKAENTDAFIKKINQYNAICVARYHALCFALQQNIPFVVISSNSHKSEALLEEVGIPVNEFSSKESDADLLPEKLISAAELAPKYKAQIKLFCSNAKTLIDKMFDDITEEKHD